MEGTPQHPRSNPLRTRHARVDGRPNARKAYASENDVSALEGSRHRRAPRTPSKPTSGPTLPPGSGSNKPASNLRNRNRAKSKNAPISPDVAHLNRQTSPYRPVSMRPSTSTAFAGATFHASPAPSALPIPSFLAKPSTDTPVHDDSGNTLQELSPLAIDTDASTPFRASSLPKPQGSPLDFMFRAHLKEKARHSLGGQAAKCADFSETTSPPPPLLAKPASPSLAHLSEAHHQPETASPSRLGQRKPKEGQGFAIGPAFSTPYHERIKAATLDTAQALPDQAKAEGPSEQRTAPVEDPAEALKKYLLAGSSNHGRARHESAVAPPADVSAGAASYVPQARIAESSPPGIPRPHDIQVMENDLRRILRMNLASES